MQPYLNDGVEHEHLHIKGNIIRNTRTVQVAAGLPAKKLSGQWSDLGFSDCVQPLEGS